MLHDLSGARRQHSAPLLTPPPSVNNTHHFGRRRRRRTQAASVGSADSADADSAVIQLTSLDCARWDRVMAYSCNPDW